MSATDPRKALPICRLVERRTGGKVQLTGRMGESRLVIVQSGTLADGTRTYSAYLAEPEPEPPGRKIGTALSPRQRAELQFTRRP